MTKRSSLRPILIPALDSIRALQARYLMRKFRHSVPQDRFRVPLHSLPADLIVSLTSYPARFDTLDLTLSSLLAQTVRPDHLILWIAHEDLAQLPQRVLELQEHGVCIRSCANLRSYKKLIPALRAFPGAFIATADDDLYYRSDWLATLVNAVDVTDRAVICRRAHRLKRRGDGSIAPYASWEWDVRHGAGQATATDLVPTGAGGILYPPGALHPVALDQALFSRLCPDGDDLWFFWTARMNGTRHRQAGGRFWRVNWPSSQQSSLWSANEAGGNDRMTAALEAEFGHLN